MLRKLRHRFGRLTLLLITLAIIFLPALFLTRLSGRTAKHADEVIRTSGTLSPALLRCLGDGIGQKIGAVQLDAACAKSPPEPCRIARLNHLELGGFTEARLRLPSSSAAIKIFIYPKGDLISDSIRQRGSWEADRVRFLMLALRAWPNSVLIDAGSSVGVYSLSAARLGRRVLAVDANYRNALRLAKSALSNGLSELIQVYWNAISDRPAGTGLRLRIPAASCNVGGANPVIESDASAAAEEEIDEARPRAAGLDHLIASSGGHLHGARSGVFLKLDIEGQEWMALDTARKLFSSRIVPLVMMEWSATAANRPDLAARIIQFLGEHGFRPYELRLERSLTTGDRLAPLSLNNWRAWPGDILWTRNVSLITDGWRA